MDSANDTAENEWQKNGYLNPMSAPFKLEDTRLRTSLLQKIRKGYRLRDACQTSGIDYSSFRRWLRDGEPPENDTEDPLNKPRPRGRGTIAERKKREYDVLRLKREFYHAVEEAEADYRSKLDEKLRKTADGSFKDLLIYARLRFPDRYRETLPQAVVQVNQAGHDGGPLTFARIAAEAIADSENV